MCFRFKRPHRTHTHNNETHAHINVPRGQHRRAQHGVALQAGKDVGQGPRQHARGGLGPEDGVGLAGVGHPVGEEEAWVVGFVWVCWLMVGLGGWEMVVSKHTEDRRTALAHVQRVDQRLRRQGVHLLLPALGPQHAVEAVLLHLFGGWG